MTEILEDIKVSKITNQEISDANSKIDIENLEEVDLKFVTILIVTLMVILYIIGIKTNEKGKQETLRKKKIIDRKKKINIHLEKEDVNKIWEKIFNENKVIING